MRLRRFSRFAVTLAILLPTGVPTSARSAADFGTLQMPGTGLRVSDSIDGLDFVVDDQGTLHVAWLATLRDDLDADAAKTQVWYRRMELGRGAWSEPVLITSGEQLPLRILSEKGRLHLLVGWKIEHFLSADDGRTWSKEVALLPQPRARTFDAILDRGEIVVAYLSAVRRGFGSQAPESVAVWSVRLSPHGEAKAVGVGVHPGIARAEPKLLVSGEDVDLFYAVSRVGRPAEAQRVDAELFHARSRGRGSEWSTPRSIATLGLQDGESRKAGNGSISHLDAARLNDQLLVFYSAGWLYATRSRDGNAWSEASAVVGARNWLGSAAVSSVAAAGDGTSGRLVWIDERYQRTDRTPLNPFGLPWFLDADWANNDVLTLPLAYFTRPTGGMISTVPLRLTRELSFAAEVRAKARTGRVYVIWAGRVRVGKRLDSAGKPPAIFYRTLPLAPERSGGAEAGGAR